MLSHVWNALEDSMAVLDDAGCIVAVNEAWRKFGARNGLNSPDACVGANYLAVCDQAQGPDCQVAQAAGAGIRNVMSGTARSFKLEYPCHSPDTERWFLLRATRFTEGGRAYLALIHEDNTARHHGDRERETSIEFLRLVDACTGVHDLVEASVRFFRERSGCEAVGIRLRAGEDYLYYEARGFPEQFVQAENTLCTHCENGEIERDSAGNPVLACMCGNVLCGRFDPARPFFTTAGTFWTNSTTHLLASTTTEDRQARTRNRCNGEGYESVALIALRVGEDRVGLLQLNDHRKNMFTPAIVALWERLAGYLAVALAHASAEEALAESEAKGRAILDGTTDMIWSVDPRQFGLLTYNHALSAYFLMHRGIRLHVGQRPEDLFLDPEYIDRWRGYYQRTLTSGPFTDEYHVFAGNHTLLLSFNLLKRKGEIFGVSVFGKDITERKHAEATLRESEALLRESQRIAGVGSYVWDIPFGLWKSSAVLDDLFGIDDAYDRSLAGWAALIHPDDRAMMVDYVQKEVLGARVLFNKEYRIVRQDNQAVRWVHGRGELELDAQGRPHCLRGTIQDITERKRAEELLRESEARARESRDELERFFALVPDMVAIGSADGYLTKVNPAWEKVLGYSLEEIQSIPFVQLIHPEDVQRTREEVQRQHAGSGIEAFVNRYRCKDGSYKWFEWRGTSASGGTRLYSIARDITHRRLADQERELSIEFLRRINTSATPRELARGIVQLLQERLDCHAVGVRLREGDDFPYLESRGFTQEFRAAESHLCDHRCPGGGTPELACLCGCVIRGGGHGMQLTSHGSFWTNNAFEFCASTPDMKSWTRGRCVADGYRSMALVPLQLGGERLGLIQLNDRRPDRFTADQIVALERMSGNLAVAFAELRYAESLRQSEEKYRVLAENIRDVVWTLDVDTRRFLYMSPSVRQLRGYSPEEIVDLPFEASFLPETAEHFEGLIRQWAADVRSCKAGSDRFYTEEVEQPCKDGSTVWTEVVVSFYLNARTGHVEARGVSRDISERKRAQEAAARHQAAMAHLARLNVMGQMVTGLAHELNQPLTAIRNYVHYCKIVAQTGKETTIKLPEALDKVDQAATRAALIIQRLREFVRKQEPTRAPADMNRIIRESLDLMAPVLQHGQTRSVMQLARELPVVMIDPVQIEQVLVNLIQNAMEAMDKTPPGRRVITICTRAARDRATIHVEVRDCGCGIPPDRLALVFEEFHTTKVDGLGLGLAISKSIAESHGGKLTARPNPDGGTIFELVLPAEKET